MSAGLYRLRAKDCRDHAEWCSDPGKRATWISLAEKWRRLAMDVEMRQLELLGRVRAIGRHDRGSGLGAWPSASALRQH